VAAAIERDPSVCSQKSVAGDGDQGVWRAEEGRLILLSRHLDNLKLRTKLFVNKLCI